MPFENDFPVTSTTEFQVTSKTLTLPTETIQHILCFLDPLELIRLQIVQSSFFCDVSCVIHDDTYVPVQISKTFHAIVNDPMVWRTVYHNACVPRFPGPFPWQSIRFLQHTLVRSAQLDQTWTSQPMKVRLSSRRQILDDVEIDCDCHWASHRWYIFSKESDEIMPHAFRRRTNEIMSHDIDSNSQQALWSNGGISSWNACEIISAQGHLIFLVLCGGDGDQHDAVKLLEFRADHDSGHLAGPIVFNVPAEWLEESGYLQCKSAPGTPFVYISVDSPASLNHSLVFDIRSQIFYKFPPFTSQLDEMQRYLTYYEWSPHNIEIFLTTTHIVVVSESYLDDGIADGYLVQAFVAPDSPIPDDMGVCELRLSHELDGFGYNRPSLRLIRSSVVNDVDGSTSIRFGQDDRFMRGVALSCTEFSLPRSRTDDILPITLNSQELFRVGSYARGGYGVEADGEGVVRGICTITGSPKGLDPVVYKFTIDATGERCVAAHSSRPSGPGADLFHPRRFRIIWFDGVRGRICYTARKVKSGDRCEIFVVELE